MIIDQCGAITAREWNLLTRKAVSTNVRYMSLFVFSSCLILELDAIARRTSEAVDVLPEAFLALEKLSRGVLAAGGSMKRDFEAWGPVLGARWLNWEMRE